MNAHQAAFLLQARSDWEMFRALRVDDRRVACHVLHYLQMATEKLAKAYLWGKNRPPGLSHVASIQFLRAITDRRSVAKALQYEKTSILRDRIRNVLPLAYEVERLAPDLAGHGPNPEYPWPPDNPMTAPVEYEFSAWEELQRPTGRAFIRLVHDLMATFEAWS